MIATDDLLDDLQRVTDELGKSPTQVEYQEHGEYSPAPFKSRFDSWNGAKEKLGIEPLPGGETVTKQELLDDLRAVRDKLGHSPTMDEYAEHGDWSAKSVLNYFDESWKAAKTEAGLEIETRGTEVGDKQLLIDDLQRVADKLGKSPEVSEYNTHGKWTEGAIYNYFDGYNVALDAAGLSLRTSKGHTDEDFLKHLRARWESSQATSQVDFFDDETVFGRGSCRSRFEKPWRALVRAGINPSVAPLPASDYNKYIQAAVAIESPEKSVMGLLRAFTGVPIRVLTQFDLSWVSRLDDNLQPPLLTVPSEYIAADEDWVMILPTDYTIAGETKPTHLDGLLEWMTDYVEITKNPRYISQIIDRAEIDTGLQSLRASVAAHLARRGKSKGQIEMQVGPEKTDWWLSVEDFYLYVYQFEGYCHPDYEPSGVYLDPETGDPHTPSSEGD